MEFDFLPYLIISLLVACVFGGITQTINENKGYKGGFAWGFWLSWVGIIIVACKRPAESQEIPPQPSEHTSPVVPPLPRHEAPMQQPSRPNTSLSAIARKPVNLVEETNTITALKEYKALLDSGIITQEEFDAKKKDLLNQ